MQPLRGTKDILPEETKIWRDIIQIAYNVLDNSNYREIKTPIIENTDLFERSIGNGTDIISKEMYSFIDQGQRNITLRPEGTASIARAFISNKLYISNNIQRLWYFGPMFRYERPQNGRQRQFHQLGIECIGSMNAIADVEVIRLATQILQKLNFNNYTIEINSIGNIFERNRYQDTLINYLTKHIDDLDEDSKHKLKSNPLRILDSKHHRTQEIIKYAPKLISNLGQESKKHFDEVCELLEGLGIKYKLNYNLVRGLDYYNYTAFEIKTKELGSQDTICGGGRYDSLIEQLGGPSTPSVGWAMGIERLIIILKKQLETYTHKPYIYLINQDIKTQRYMWNIIEALEKANIKFELDLSNNNFSKQIKKAYNSGAQKCIIIGDQEVSDESITIKDLTCHSQETINLSYFIRKCSTIIYNG